MIRLSLSSGTIYSVGTDGIAGGKSAEAPWSCRAMGSPPSPKLKAASAAAALLVPPGARGTPADAAALSAISLLTFSIQLRACENGSKRRSNVECCYWYCAFLGIPRDQVCILLSHHQADAERRTWSIIIWVRNAEIWTNNCLDEIISGIYLQ